MVYVFTLLVLSLVIALASQWQTGLIECQSKSCKFNKDGRCKKKFIHIYDNGVLGLCLWHSESMEKRVVEPFLKGQKVGEKIGEITVIDKIISSAEDMQLIRSSEEFEKWMKKNLPKNQV